ncbi:TolC family protein, partial [Vibrio metoecus]
MPTAHAAPISFQDAWELLQQQNNSLAAQRANVERYSHLKDATQNLNLPSVSVGANFTRLDQDVTLSGKQIVDSTGGIDPNLIASLPSNILPVVAKLASTKSTITERDIFTSSIRAIWPIFTGGRIT